MDAVPVAGDLLFISRKEAAKREGVEYPSTPVAVENAASDLPPPLATFFDLAISQNVLHYLETEYDVELANVPEDAVTDAAENFNSLVEDLTPSETPFGSS